MSYDPDYWRDDPSAPFAELLGYVNGYCHPEAYDEAYEDLKKFARDPALEEKLSRFKEQLRQALDDPSRIPSDALYDAAQFDDGTDERFLRRLWRDLYPGEPVPGGDEEFRADLRKTIHGEIDRTTSTTRYYDDRWGEAKSPDDMKELGRKIWQRFYPDEPLP